MKILSTTLACCLAAPTLVAQDVLLTDSGGVPRVDVTQYINAASVRAMHAYGMDLDNSSAEFDFTDISLFAFITKPIDLGGDWSFISYLDLGVTSIGFDGNPLIGSFANDIESNLYQVGTPLIFVHASPGSRWLYGAWIAPSISSDFDHIDSDDFFLDGAIAAAYRVNDCLTIGAGVYVSDVFHDTFAIPGLGFIWTPTEDWLISYYGPRFVARRQINDRNQIGFEIATNGGNWNVDANNNSLKVDLRSWRSGVYYRYNITGELWLEAAAGFTFANKLELQTRDGDDIFGNRLGDAGSAPYASIGLSVARW